MTVFRLISTIALSTLVVFSASAQTSGLTPPSPEAIAVAQQVIAKVNSNRPALLQSMSAPLIQMMQSTSHLPMERVQIIVKEGVLPLLDSNLDRLFEMQAQSYASIYTIDDLKGLLSFYNSTAGQDFLRLQPQAGQALLLNINTLMSTLQPDIIERVKEIAKVHGWGKPTSNSAQPG